MSAKVKTLTAGIQVTESFLQKLVQPKNSPEYQSAQRAVFNELQRIEKDITEQLDKLVHEYQDQNVQWEDK